MNKLLIATGATTQEYASITGALTGKDAATNAGLLASGSVGIYGIVELNATGTAALNLESLITEAAATDTAGKVLYSGFDDTAANRTIRIAQGGTFPVSTGSFDRFGVTKITRQAYVAPVKEVSFVGFNGVSGSLGLPTITAGSEAAIIAVQKEGTTKDQMREQENYSTGGLLASTAAYDILSPIVTNINTQQGLSKSHTAFVVSNGSYTNTTTTGNVTVTKGSTLVSFTAIPAAGWAAAVGQFISINNTAAGVTTINAAATNVNGVVYKIVSISGNDVTLDRPYEGTTATITGIQTGGAGAGAMALLTGTTEWGVKLVVDEFGASYDYAKQGVLENATLTASVAPVKGLGYGPDMVKIEQGLIAYRGQFDTYSKWAVQLPTYASASTNYDVYTIQMTQGTTATGAPHNKTANSTIMIAFPTTQAASTSFGVIMKALCPNAGTNY
jgi:hypothetical protein